MPYSVTTWADTPATSSPISAANLNKIETELARLKVNADFDPAAAIAYSKLALALSIVNGDVSASAAIAYSKLNLASSIVNADVAAAAAIALSKLADPGTGNVVTSVGSGAVSAKPPGYVYDYTQVTTDQTSTATTTASATAIVTGGAVTYDGSTVVLIEFFVPNWELSVNTQNMLLSLYDGSTELGLLCTMRGGSVATQENGPLRVARRLTPSAAAHTYSIRASSSGAATATFKAGAGTIGVYMPMYLRQSRDG